MGTADDSVPDAAGWTGVPTGVPTGPRPGRGYDASTVDGVAT